MREHIFECLRQHRTGRVRASPRAEKRGLVATVPAAVLIPMLERAEGLTVLFTQRTAHLADHSSEVSFPGGRWQAGDSGPIDTALRESEEEVGLARESVDIAGVLDVYNTGTGFSVTPVVGFVRPPIHLVPDPFEVEAVFEVPLRFLLDPANRRQERRRYPEGVFDYHLYEYGGYRIWGATAGILVGFADLLVKGQAP